MISSIFSSVVSSLATSSISSAVVSSSTTSSVSTDSSFSVSSVISSISVSSATSSISSAVSSFSSSDCAIATAAAISSGVSSLSSSAISSCSSTSFSSASNSSTFPPAGSARRIAFSSFSCAGTTVCDFSSCSGCLLLSAFATITTIPITTTERTMLTQSVKISFFENSGAKLKDKNIQQMIATNGAAVARSIVLKNEFILFAYLIARRPVAIAMIEKEIPPKNAAI